MRITRTLTVVGVQEKQPEPRGWAASSGFLAGKIVLQSGMYAEIFGGTMKAHARGRPWKRGVVTIQVKRPEGLRSIRRVFAGNGALPINQEEICLDASACSELGIAWGEKYAFELCGSTSLLGRGYDRLIHYWNHPVDAVRASFKLGLLGCALAFKDEAIAVLLVLVS